MLYIHCIDKALWLAHLKTLIVITVSIKLNLSMLEPSQTRKLHHKQVS